MTLTASEMARKRWEGVGPAERTAAARHAVAGLWRKLGKRARSARAKAAAQKRKVKPRPCVMEEPIWKRHRTEIVED